ncbi:MAG: HAMP domain-containing histidine kinase, partial [Desulfobacteraceae bacterium]|nr:HAMP domain-containing histidine kinase [Desulfobacteraceae bacterium]
NPLAVINAAVLLANRSLGDKKKVERHLETVLKASRKIAIINKNIMTYGKTLGGKTTSLKVKTFLNDCLSIFKGLISLDAIKIKTDFKDLESIPVLEPYKLEQIFSNLILNAIDAMDGCNNKHLEITGSCDKKAGTWAFDIRDSGCGISNDDLNKIFLPYFTTKNHGTGLGLSIVKQTVKSLGGEIKIKSQPDRGSGFTVTLPLNRKDQDI